MFNSCTSQIPKIPLTFPNPNNNKTVPSSVYVWIIVFIDKNPFPFVDYDLKSLFYQHTKSLYVFIFLIFSRLDNDILIDFRIKLRIDEGKSIFGGWAVESNSNQGIVETILQNLPPSMSPKINKKTINRFVTNKKLKWQESFLSKFTKKLGGCGNDETFLVRL